MVIPYGAGSSTDGFARVIADGLSRVTGQPVVPVNRPGANGMLAVRSLLTTPADGYTFAILANGIIIDQVLKKGADFDIRTDLMPVVRAVEAPMGVFVSNALPVNSIKELVEYAKKNPGKINYASSGVGSVGQLLTERFRLATGLSLVHVPYPGGNATISAALMAGDVHISVSDIGSMRQLVNDKRIKYLATLADERSPIFPDAPAISEVGMPELRKIFSPFFFGFFVARGTDPAHVEKLATDINATLQDPAVREKLVGLGYNAAALGGTRPRTSARSFSKNCNGWRRSFATQRSRWSSQSRSGRANAGDASVRAGRCAGHAMYVRGPAVSGLASCTTPIPASSGEGKQRAPQLRQLDILPNAPNPSKVDVALQRIFRNGNGRLEHHPVDCKQTIDVFGACLVHEGESWQLAQQVRALAVLKRLDEAVSMRPVADS